MYILERKMETKLGNVYGEYWIVLEQYKREPHTALEATYSPIKTGSERLESSKGNHAKNNLPDVKEKNTFSQLRGVLSSQGYEVY